MKKSIFIKIFFAIVVLGLVSAAYLLIIPNRRVSFQKEVSILLPIPGRFVFESRGSEDAIGKTLPNEWHGICHPVLHYRQLHSSALNRYI